MLKYYIGKRHTICLGFGCDAFIPSLSRLRRNFPFIENLTEPPDTPFWLTIGALGYLAFFGAERN